MNTAEDEHHHSKEWPYWCSWNAFRARAAAVEFPWLRSWCVIPTWPREAWVMKVQIHFQHTNFWNWEMLSRGKSRKLVFEECLDLNFLDSFHSEGFLALITVIVGFSPEVVTWGMRQLVWFGWSTDQWISSCSGWSRGGAADRNQIVPMQMLCMGG